MNRADEVALARERVHEIRNTLHAIAMHSAVIREGLENGGLQDGSEAEAVASILALCTRCSDQLDDVARRLNRLAGGLEAAE